MRFGQHLQHCSRRLPIRNILAGSDTGSKEKILGGAVGREVNDDQDEYDDELGKRPLMMSNDEEGEID